MPKPNIKQEQYDLITETHRFVTFKGATFVLNPPSTYTPLTETLYAQIHYRTCPYSSISQIREVEHMVRTQSPDLSHLSHLIGFPDHTVWNTKTLRFTTSKTPPIIQSAIAPTTAALPQVQAYLLQLAAGDQLLAQDYLQAIAPLFMDRKPTGVVWFIGGGANGKSALLNALYRIIGTHLTSMTVSAIEDGRDTPRLNGVLGNICRESSEARITDTERYKAIGTHEPFQVHKFHSQSSVHIDANFHTIQNANNIPIFSDKTEGARRRTIIIPFPAKFPDNPMFEDKTFTPEFLGSLLHLILEATTLIVQNGYQYNFSPAALGAKIEYDAEVNSAEAFLTHLRDNKVRAFNNYGLLQDSYENWCRDHGYVPLGRTSLKRVMVKQGKATTTTQRDENGDVCRWYFLDNYDPTLRSDLVSLDNGFHVWLKAEDNTPKQTALGANW